MSPDFVFITTYECPRCHAELEDRSGGAPAWVRCPKCGRACLSPEPDHEGRGIRFEPDEPSATPTPVLFGDQGTPAMPFRPRPMVARPPVVAKRVLTTRMTLGSGFFLTAVLCVLALLDANGLGATIFGAASLLFLFLLSRPIAPNVRG